ncbi:hypothetical protein G9464_06580 [Halostella sp. JP-L12]|uniref:hypothetical protein n=1 Tax=Halostella TaxID=1843185 RepID=UPI000EF77DFB|nr:MULTISPECIES: hypothetical protein [Halostella]NHN47263.1 hypothetical protein [Halostella sp. JP-L12]
MVEDSVADGRRIAELLASEVDGRVDGVLDRLAVVNPDRSVEGTPDGERAYDVERAIEGTWEDARTRHAPDETRGELLAEVYVHEDRARIEFREEQDAAAAAAGERDLRVRPKAVDPPKTLVFVESGAEVKRAVDVVEAVVEALD